MERLAPDFERAYHVCLIMTHMLNPDVPGHVATGADWDIAITNPCHVDDIVAAGHAERSACRPFARTPLAFAARGARGPVARSVEGLIALLRAARSIALTDVGTSGGAFRHLARRLGLWEDLRDRLLCLEGGGPMRAVLEGRAELAALPLTNIAPVEGAAVAGICPAELEAEIALSLCLSPGASASARLFADWLLDPALDERLGAMGAMRGIKRPGGSP